MKEQVQDRQFINHNIRFPKVTLIDKDGKNLGIMQTQDALRLAREAELDLVQVAPPSREKPPTCRLMDFGKYKYELSKKEKESAKKQKEHEIKIKEIQFGVNIADNDLKIKVDKTREFLNKGYRCKIVCVFKGREITHTNLGFDLIDAFLNMLGQHKLLEKPSMDQKDLIAVIEKL